MPKEEPAVLGKTRSPERERFSCNRWLNGQRISVGGLGFA
jgi:hypothetical protein